MKRKQKKESLDIALSEPVKPEEQSTAGEEKTQKGRKKKYAIISILVVFLALFAAGAAICVRNGSYYQAHFLPNTTINGIDCSNLDLDSAVALLDRRASEYVLEVIGRDYKTGESGFTIGKIMPADIELHYEGTRETVEDFLNGQESFKWIQAYMGETSSYQLEQNMIFDREMLKDTVKGWDACRKGNMLQPENAYIGGYSEADKCYVIVPETKGAELNVDEAVQLVCEAVTNAETMLDLEEKDCYMEASVKQDNKKLTDTLDKVNGWLSTCITYDWNGTEVILDYNTLKDWITIQNGEPVLDEEQVTQFVKAQASLYDTYGKKRNFMTTLGVELTLPSGYYGWKTDKDTETAELIELIYEGSSTEREPVYSSTAMQKGMSDIGDSYVEVDITNQHVYLYIDGEVVLETDCVTGNMSRSCDTPEGVFGIAYKQKGAVLRGSDYETPVTYWMPFYGNYGMHDAYWRSAFGGNIYKTNGSRGCVNLPPTIAEKIFGYVHKGFPVICYYYEQNPIKKEGSGSSSGSNRNNGGGSGESASSQTGEEETPETTEGTQPGEGDTPGTIEGTQPGEGGTPGTIEGTQPAEGGTPGINDGTQPAEGGTPGINEGTQPAEGGTPGINDGTQPAEGGTPGTTEGVQPGENNIPGTIEGTQPIENNIPGITEGQPPADGAADGVDTAVTQ